MEAKSWYHSKTIWANLAALVAAGGIWAQGGFGTGGVVAILLPAVMPLVNIALRIITKQPID